jgi:hypothetical protein
MRPVVRNSVVNVTVNVLSGPMFLAHKISIVVTSSVPETYQLLNVRLNHQSVRESTFTIAILQIGIYNIESHAYEKEHRTS